MRKEHEPVLVKPFLNRVYDSMEFTLASGLTNYDVRTNVTGAFENFGVYTTINIRTDQTVTVRFNSTSNRAITLNSNRPFELNDLMEITDIYISNASGSTANIKIVATRKGA